MMGSSDIHHTLPERSEGPTPPASGTGFRLLIPAGKVPRSPRSRGSLGKVSVSHCPPVRPCARSGFALFTVLWLIVALSVVTTLALGTGRVGRWESANRIALRRGRWAADACLEILLGRYAAQGAAPLDSVDLGSGTWCRARIEDPEAKLNINTASDSTITAALGNDTLAAALLDWRDPDDSARAGGSPASTSIFDMWARYSLRSLTERSSVFV